MSEEQSERTGEEQDHKGRRVRKERVSRRRRQVKRGKRFVTLVLIGSVLFYLAFFAVVLTDVRFEFGDNLVRLISTSIIVGAIGAIGIWFAIASYRGNEVIRHLYVTLNAIGGIAGTIWLVMRYAGEYIEIWMLLDLAGVIVAFSVCGALFLSRGGVMFLDEQNLRRR